MTSSVMFQARSERLELRVPLAGATDIELSAPNLEVIRAAIARAAALLDTHRAELRAMREIALSIA